MPITDGFDLISAHAYAEKGVPHNLWTRLRAESPVHRCDPAGFEPFWAITKHADICEIGAIIWWSTAARGSSAVSGIRSRPGIDG